MKKINKNKIKTSIKNKSKNFKEKSKQFTNNVSKNIKKDKTLGQKILLVIIIIIICMLILGGIFFGFVVITSPKFNPKNLYRTQSSILYDENGEEFARIGEQNRQLLEYDELSETLVDAIVATEDSRFFEHNGFDLPRFMVASLKQITGQGGGGASTLTMQVSKNNFTSAESSGIKGIIRKFQDIYISVFKIEKKYTKEQIVEFYVNSNYMGAGAWGVETASQTYFQKSASQLNIAESALLAGIFNAPDYYDPIKNPENAEERRQTVLYLMKRHKYITKEEYEAALKLNVYDLLNVSKDENKSDYLGYINTVVDDVIKKTKKDPYTTPMKIYTTMNKSQQDYLDALINEKLSFKFRDKVAQTGIAIVDVEDGSVSAVAAGRNLAAKGFNHATDLKNQIGSTAKPLYDYGPAIEYNGIGTGEPCVDEPWTYSGTNITIRNADIANHGIVTIKKALSMSLNTCALKTFQKLNSKNVYEFVTNLGLHPEVEGNNLVHEAHSLGGYNGESPLSMAAAYAAFANGGYYTEPYTFTKINYLDTDEEYVYKPTKKRAMSEETAYIVMQMLIATTRYYGNYANGVTFGSKTGTTNLTYDIIKKYGLPSSATQDTWKMALSAKYSIGLWYGYDKLSSEYYMTPFTTQREQLYYSIIKNVFTENKQFKKPNGVITVETEDDAMEAVLASEFTPKSLRTTSYYVKGTEPTKVSDRFSKLENVKNLSATARSGETTLSWDPIETPNAINVEYLTKLYEKNVKNPSIRQTYLNQRLSYNTNNIGELVYKIYVKEEDKLNFIGETKDSSYTFPSIGGTNTFIVKSSYTIFTANASDGESIDVTTMGSNITFHLVDSITANINSRIDYNSLLTIKENGNKIDNDKANIEIDDSNVNYNKKGKYTVYYEIKYKNVTKKMTLKVIIN